MPDTFTPDQFNQPQRVPPVSSATPCATTTLEALRSVIYDGSCEIEHGTCTIETGLELAGALLEKLCREIYPPEVKGHNPVPLELINQVIFVLDSIKERATHIVAESDKIYRASLKEADVGTPCSNS